MSYYPPPPAPPARRGAPVGWTASMATTSGLVFLVCLWVLWHFTASNDRLGAFFLGGCAIMILGIGWLVLAILGMAKYNRFVLSAIVPAVVVMTLILLWSGIPGRIGWAFSKPALERAAADCTRTDDAGRIGLFDFDYVRPEGDGGCSFSLKNSGFGPDGYAYFPREAPANPGAGAGSGTRYHRYDGNWYTFTNFVESWI
ncbi:hypothetical protein [Nocardia inohanensis]|uniref:hypothetical protein n=1 Tax=Nocardia inohanensis TaxID=209246 RepID=UPI000A60BF3A|nr:hypothetical protein [Nocardia inohanensis]